MQPKVLACIREEGKGSAAVSSETSEAGIHKAFSVFGRLHKCAYFSSSNVSEKYYLIPFSSQAFECGADEQCVCA